MFIDQHCHIEDEETIERAFNANLAGLLNAGKDLDEMEFQLRLTEKYNNVWTSAGVHPDEAPNKLNKITTETIIEKTKHPKVIAIGECGLDYYYGKDYKEAQKEMFSRHISASGITKLPLMIHQRQAEEDTLSLLYDGIKKYGSLTGVIHCFTSSIEFAKEVEKLGFYISASGIITFKTGIDILNVFKSYSKDKILIETDSPYLTPVPFRGNINEPVYITKTAEKLAHALKMSLEELSHLTTKNFFNLYTKANNNER
ncbi:MAG: TatD family hydrolase [Alphaproteobacteria bacterium]|nr:TatD family hydrolase [Alphaproteobacteria bacterium]